ncbi:DUF2165 family protein [Pelagicoccus albus]|uniref:DUF2165 domain-containing protein n=1 Tax=Pelagicoccus albus TaxID=415222 RepID=A0A7X1B8Z1_9BACT|nr:DUF2165 domain-containing protein [Pelagicoccus albus]MBC2607871.1 DUF2165 domain-containing protein [Pelagicoccus albus]
MPIRLCKIALTAASVPFLLLVVFNNITDYGSNYAFVEGVLKMDTTFEGNGAMWRSIDSPWVYHVFYATIICWEFVSMVILGMGVLRLYKARGKSAAEFNKAKGLAVLGLTVSMLQWYLAFLVVGAEWFLMWQSNSFNGQDAATRMFLTMGISLLFLISKDSELES